MKKDERQWKRIKENKFGETWWEGWKTDSKLKEKISKRIKDDKRGWTRTKDKLRSWNMIKEEEKGWKVWKGTNKGKEGVIEWKSIIED